MNVNSFSLKSLVAVAAVAMAPLALADAVSEGPMQGPAYWGKSSGVSVQSVRAEARQAPPQARGDANDVPQTPFVSTKSRAQVRAEAIEAMRLGLTSDAEGDTLPTPAQLAQISAAGQRASGNTVALSVTR